MKRILVVAGTRPEAIKLAPVIGELKRRAAETLVCVTGQHRQMLDQVLGHFKIEPDFDLDVMEDGQELPALTATLMNPLTELLERVHPDVVVVQGDTTTVMVTATAAFYAGVEVAHVEAGLRSHDMYSPFPEEFNRRAVSLVASYHFAPTPVAEAQLITEGIDPERVWMTGNTIVDALLETVKAPLTPEASRILEEAAAAVSDRGVGHGVGHGVGRGREGNGAGGTGAGEALLSRLVLVTAHRRENFREGIAEICRGVRQIVDAHPDVVAVYPVHMNRNVHDPVHELLGGTERVILTEPVDYPTLVHLMKAATLILTDSGGIQEEAPTLGKPVLVLRTETERPEGIEAGTALLVGPSAARIEEAASRLLGDAEAYAEMARAANPYGDGRAAERIADVLVSARGG